MGMEGLEGRRRMCKAYPDHITNCDPSAMAKDNRAVRNIISYKMLCLLPNITYLAYICFYMSSGFKQQKVPTY